MARWLIIMPIVVITVAACSFQRGGQVGRESPPVHWYGDIFVGGADSEDEPFVATLSTTRLTERTARSTVTLRGQLPEGKYPWHIHVGECTDGSNGPLLGNPDDYPMLTPDAEGYYNATANLRVGLAEEESYYINIHNAESVSPMTTIVACGELQRRGT